MSASPIVPRPVRLCDVAGAPQHRTAATPSCTQSKSLPPLQGDTIVVPEPPRVALRDVAASRRSALVETLLAHVPSGDRIAAKTAIPAILDAARESGSTDPNRVAYLLATAQTESDFGAHMTETGHSRAWFNSAYGSTDGNRAGTNDGYAYRGRGYVQATHEGRYAELAHRLGLPTLVTHPEELADPKIAAKALVVGVQKNLFTHNAAAALERTIPTGKKPGDVDFYHARGIVNGIVKDQAQTIARHATVYARVLDSYRHSVLEAPVVR